MISPRLDSSYEKVTCLVDATRSINVYVDPVKDTVVNVYNFFRI